MLSSDGRIERLALTAVLNVSEDEEAASVLNQTCELELCAESLLGCEKRELAHLYTVSLSNLTPVPSGVEQLVTYCSGECIRCKNAQACRQYRPHRRQGTAMVVQCWSQSGRTCRPDFSRKS